VEVWDLREAPFAVALGHEVPRIKDNLAILSTFIQDIRHVRAQLGSGWKALLGLEEVLVLLQDRAAVPIWMDHGVLEDEIASIRNGIGKLRSLVGSKGRMRWDYHTKKSQKELQLEQ
jgi:hypothetical protein